MGVFLDPRAGSGDLLGSFPQGYCEELILDSGDVMGVGNGPDGPVLWGVEIKKLEELIQSMQSGRLREQIGKMQEDYDWRFLLVEGHYRRHPDTGVLQKLIDRGKYLFWSDAVFGAKQKIMYGHFQSWLLTMAVGTGTMLINTGERQETVDTVVALGRMFDKEWENHGTLKTFHLHAVPGLVVPSIPMLVAKDLADGMGWDKAIKACEYFKTVRAMANATVDEWKQVPGIDKVLAERAVNGITLPHALRRYTRRKGKLDELITKPKRKRSKK